jgi:glucosamine-phosphate N-acetyltransferase
MYAACLQYHYFNSPTLLLIQIRPLAATDYKRGHLAVLSVLTVVTDPGEVAWRAQFNTMRSAPSTYYSLVILNKTSDQIVGVGTVVIERKFLRGLGTVGHIEDIAVDKNQQGKKLGLRIIQALTHISENVGCYKTILNCSDANVREYSQPSLRLHTNTFRIAFYQKCGFEKKEVEMVRPSSSPPMNTI